jgi:uncharacterized protein YoxC
MTDIRNAHARIDRLEQTVHEHSEKLENFGESLHENTRLTKQIADNTDEIVSLFKGSKVLYKIITGVAALVAIFYAVLTWIHK